MTALRAQAKLHTAVLASHKPWVYGERSHPGGNVKTFNKASACLPIALSILVVAAATAHASPGPAPETPQQPDRQPHRSLRRAPGPAAVIPPGGGTIGLPGYATVLFAPGTFPWPQLAKVEKTSSSATAQAFADSAEIFQPGSTPGYEIRINTGLSKPQVSVEVTVVVPADFAIPAGSRVEAFAQFWEQDELDALDSFELIPSTFDEPTRAVTLTLPPAAFTSQRRGDGTFEAIVMLAATPGAVPPQVLSFSLATAAATILPPLETTQVRSPFNPTRQVTVGGVVYTGHWGTDFIAANGTPIFATGDGEVLRAYNSGDKSFGESVLFRMKDNGVVRYAHLQSYDVENGDKILAGQEIGLTDNTGLSTGAHLHFELAPDGKFASNKSKVDPAPLIHDRPLTWHLTAHAVYDAHSTVPEIVNYFRLQLMAEADLLMESDGPSGMRLTLVSGVLFVQSATAGYNDCTVSYVLPRSYPLKMHEGVVIPAEGDTGGGAGFQREFTHPPPRMYTCYGAFYTNERPEGFEYCPGRPPSPVNLDLANLPWWYIVGPRPFRLDPEFDVTEGTVTVDNSTPGISHMTVTYDWTLTKTY